MPIKKKERKGRKIELVYDWPNTPVGKLRSGYSVTCQETPQLNGLPDGKVRLPTFGLIQ